MGFEVQRLGPRCFQRFLFTPYLVEIPNLTTIFNCTETNRWSFGTQTCMSDNFHFRLLTVKLVLSNELLRDQTKIHHISLRNST